MKTRIISGILGIGILVLILFFYDTLFLNFAVSCVCVMMVYEIFCATKMFEKSFLVFFVSALFSFVLPFLKLENGLDFRIFAICFYVAFNVLFLLKKNREFRVYDIFFCCVFTIFLTLFTSNIIYIRFKFKPYGLYYIILFFIISWVCDIGAYFVGVIFGKTKLAPNISPKKTVEGFIGGIVFSSVVVFIYSYIYLNFNSFKMQFNYLNLVIATILGVIFATVGDLSFSVFKRQRGIKDFGNILKGHGGMLDRFDSWIFVSAILYPFIKSFPILIF